ncbi:methylamine utilization protein MauJ [Indioceanicola profundi]|uniref:methylamine utilization protein MauJ n=1 Tax=Indioceanicola profundi TaxID=2220096 RepID=UPI000E6AB19F
MVRASREDRAEREFLVAVYLLNPLTRAWDIDLLLEAEFSIAAPGGAEIQIAAANGANGRLGELICRSQAASAEAAVELVYDAVADLLGRWCVTHGRGMEIAGLRVADMVHQAKWRAVPFRPSTIDATADIGDGLTAEHRALAALYRQARNASSPIQRLLCAMRILDSFAAGQRHLKSLPTGSCTHNMFDNCSGFRVSREMLVLSGAWSRHADLEGQDLHVLIQTLQPVRTRLLGMLAGEALDTDIGTYSWLFQLSGLANLADCAAHQILSGDFALWRQSRSSDYYDMEEVV